MLSDADLGDGHARVEELLPALVADRGHERGRLPDQAQLPSINKPN